MQHLAVDPAARPEADRRPVFLDYALLVAIVAVCLIAVVAQVRL